MLHSFNNLATTQVRKDSLIDVKLPWSFGVIKESEMMLEWAAEQATEITTTAIDLKFLPKDTNEDRGVQNLEFVLQEMHTALMTRMTLSPSRGRIRWLEARRRLQKRYDPTTGVRKRNLLRTIILSWTVLSSGTPSGERTLGVLRVSLRDKLGDEIKLAGPE